MAKARQAGETPKETLWLAVLVQGLKEGGSQAGEGHKGQRTKETYQVGEGVQLLAH